MSKDTDAQVASSGLLTIKQAARLLNIPVSRARLLVKAKSADRLPHYRIPGKLEYRFKYEEIMHWLENHRGA